MNEAEIHVGDRGIRVVNEEILQALESNNSVVVTETLSRHNLGIGLPQSGKVRFKGSVGYYCGGLNTGTDVIVDNNSGWGTGEAMSGGSIKVNGYAGMSTGAAMFGGLIHVKGDCGPRCGVAMKGGDIVVEGKLGYQAGFMAHHGRIIALGGASTSCGDALWQAEVWVAGDIESLGVDALIVEPDADEIEAVELLLQGLALDDRTRNWRKIVSGKKLWFFESRDANSWLMI